MSTNPPRLPILRHWVLPDGTPFKVLPWERKAAQHIASRRVSAISMARGNGKSGWLSQLLAFYGVGPAQKPGSDCVVCAASLSQAAIPWRDFAAGLRILLPDWRKQGLRITNNPTGRVEVVLTDSSAVRAMSSRPESLHGLRPNLMCIDEPAQINPPSTGERLFAALRTATGKIPGSRLVVAGTRPADPSHWFSRLLQSPAGLLWAADKDDDPFLEATWRKANPSWDFFPELRKAIREEAKEAQTDPLALAMFRALRLNLGVADTEELDVLMSPESWLRAETDNPPQREGDPIWGIDLGGAEAMSAVSPYWASGRLESAGWFGDTPTLIERGRKHGVGDLYQRMADRGELRTVPGRIVPVPTLLSEALSLFGQPRLICCDRWRASELLDGLDKVGLGRVAIDWRGMGYKDGGADTRAFMNAFLGDEVKLNPSLLLASAISNAKVMRDPAGNMKLVKRSTNSGYLIDALSAAVVAVAAQERHPAPEWSFAFAAGDGSPVQIM